MIKILIQLLVFFGVSLMFGQPVPFVPDTNTIGLWHLNEGTGLTAYDTSGNGLDGTLENGVSWDQDGMFGSCLKYSENYHRVRVVDTPILDIATDLTIEAWIKLDSTNDGGHIISKWHTNTANPKGQYALGISSNNKLFVYLGDDTSQFTINSDTNLVEFDQWILASAVFSNGQVGLFINGQQIAASPVPFDTLTALEYPHDDLFIGDLWTDLYYPYSFDGKIDEVRISNIARYQITITDIRSRQTRNLPLTPILEQNYPNPFNPITTIRFELLKNEEVELIIYDILGRKVTTLVNKKMIAGRHEVEWDAANFGSGLYFYQLRAGNFNEVKKMLLVK